MITQIEVKKFQKANTGSDVMGVVRTLYPNVDITISKKKGNR